MGIKPVRESPALQKLQAQLEKFQARLDQAEGEQEALIQAAEKAKAAATDVLARNQLGEASTSDVKTAKAAVDRAVSQIEAFRGDVEALKASVSILRGRIAQKRQQVQARTDATYSKKLNELVYSVTSAWDKYATLNDELRSVAAEARSKTQLVFKVKNLANPATYAGARDVRGNGVKYELSRDEEWILLLKRGGYKVADVDVLKEGGIVDRFLHPFTGAIEKPAE